MTARPDERVVLVDDAGCSVGTAPKATSHSVDTPLHLAFSCYVFDREGRLLITRRAQDKATFPGVWTNSFCGHPAPDEDVFEAVRRRAGQELGLVLEDLGLVLPRFRYQATMDNGVRENELCPVFIARATGGPRPDPAEVADVAWLPWTQFRDEVLAGRRQVSSWCALQVSELAELEEADGTFPQASTADLPAAARPGPS